MGAWHDMGTILASSISRQFPSLVRAISIQKKDSMMLLGQNETPARNLIIMYIIVYPSVSECKYLSHTIFYPLVNKQLEAGGG
jgi:hypothetical protein